MSNLTHAEWRRVCSEANGKLTQLITERERAMNEMAELDVQVRDMSQEIIKQERFIASLQWAQPKPPRGYKTKPHEVSE